MSTVIFPGQGSQHVGMSKDFYDNFSISRQTLEEIQDYTNYNLKEIIFEDKNNLLNTTKYTQISVFAASLMIFKALELEKILNFNEINVMMGHSLGEYTSLACSKKINLKDCCNILKIRSDLMNNAVEPNKTGMAAIVGKDCNFIQKIIDENNINLEVANDNSPLQVVVSGDMNEIKNNQDFFLNNNIKRYIILNVSAAFHSKFMKNAQFALSEEIDKIKFSQNQISLVSNFTAEISKDTLEIKNSLKSQMANKVRWTESVTKINDIGEKKIIEIGPNKILSGLIKRISDNFDIKSYNKLSDIN